jgi:hypothetical protein
LKNKKISITTVAQPIQESWEIWNHLTKNGLDTIYYDNEFLNGNSSFNGLSHYLGFKVDKNTITDRLRKNKVSAERFIGAFFKVLQPYAQMMNDLCIFFSTYKVKSTNESIKIVFDFDNVKEQLDFNLANFRSVLTNYTKIKKKVTFYNVPNVWALHSFFEQSRHVDKSQIKNNKAVDWLSAYDKGKMLKPELTIPITGYSGLDVQLQRVLDLWSDYVNACRDITENTREFYGKLSQLENDSEVSENNDQLIGEDIDLNVTWNLTNLRAESDRWTATMIELLFVQIESLQKLPKKDRDESAGRLETDLQSYFDGLPKSEKEMEDVVKELTDLLNLPVWKKRYELYSTWVMSVIDESLAGYEKEVHDDNGVLLLNFSKTRLMTVQSASGPFELWAENRTLLSNPTGHGRKNAIQPDYTIYQPTIGDVNDCIACVEVKQYRKASVKNFGNALNDYANGLPKANIFLANYGPVPASLPLVHPSRSEFFGHVQPSSLSFIAFKGALLSVMPLAKALTAEELLKKNLSELHLDTVFVDVSGSMDRSMKREYIRACLRNLLKQKKVAFMVALDDDQLHSWTAPGKDDIEELFFSHFYGGGDFSPMVLGTDKHNLIITDSSGASNVYESGFRPIIILLDDENAELWIYDETSDLYNKHSSESLDITYNSSEKGFAGWLYSI